MQYCVSPLHSRQSAVPLVQQSFSFPEEALLLRLRPPWRLSLFLLHVLELRLGMSFSTLVHHLWLVVLQTDESLS